MKAKNLKLIARTEEDLRVVSAYLQDSIASITDIANLKKNKILLMQLNRFMWEDVEKGVFRKNKRIRTVLKFENVVKVSSKKIVQKKTSRFLDFLTIESIMLRDLYQPFKFYLSDTVIKIMDRGAENSVSHGNTLQYCRGSAYSISATISLKRFNEMTVKMKILTVINYFRYSIHGDIGFIDSVKMWQLLQKHYLYSILFLVSYAVSIRDKYRKKLEKTHIEFNRNRAIAKISVKYFN